jgi:hypothetical protein
LTKYERVQASLIDKGNQPCVGCRMSVVCAEQQVACESFARWVNGQSRTYMRAPKEPNKAWFDRMMKSEA